MNNKLGQFYICAVIVIFYFICTVTTAQIDSTTTANTPIIIGDSAFVNDSTKIKPKTAPFIIHFNERSDKDNFNAFSLSKKEIDFTDYRYTGNIVSHLPFGFLDDLGSLGTPNEAFLYNNGWGNISLFIDNISLNNSFNNSSRLNSIQTESISSFNLAPLTRGFLYGFINNPAALLIQTNDSIKSKPITRLRYYQAPNEEGFVDAMFSARVLPRLAIAFRLTNSSIDKNYTNTSFGSWKFNFKSIYKISDSILTKLDYNHRKLNTQLNGGVDVAQFDQSSQEDLNIYSIEYPVVYSIRGDTTTQNTISASIYGRLTPFGYTNLTFGFSESDQLFYSSMDTISNRYNNYHKSLTSTLEHRMLVGDFSAIFNTGYEKFKTNIDEFDLEHELDNYYTSMVLSFNFLNKSVTPSIFGKYSNFNSQSSSGYGTDILVKPLQNLKLLFGYSIFDKPYSILESQYISSVNKQTHNILFTSIELQLKKFRTTLSYFNINIKNAALPISISESNIEKFDYILEDERQSSGINFNSKIELWNVLATTNLNFYQNSKSLYQNMDDIFTLNAGLFYVDTLYNNNLNLKTGFILYLFDNSNYGTIDFQYLRSANYTSTDGIISKPLLQPVVNDKMRVDFYLAGRIQDAATFYFIYENILGNYYYVAPYYPMPEGGMRIGISWDFLD